MTWFLFLMYQWMESKSKLKLFLYSIFMVWLHEEFIIYIGLALHYRMLDSSFFRLVIFTSFSIEKIVFHYIDFWFWWLLQELGQERAYISESLFTVIFLSFILVRILNFHSLASMKFHKDLWFEICAFAVDFSSFHIEEQKDLHSSYLVQSSSFLICKCWSHLVLLISGSVWPDLFLTSLLLKRS